MTKTVRLRCPFRTMPDADPCDAPLEVTIDPAERQTWGYPGSPASIAGTDGCHHGLTLTEDDLWAAIDAQRTETDVPEPPR